MEINPTPEPQTGSNKNRNLIIAVAAAVILCCCCLAAGVGGYYVYQGYVQAQQAIEDLQNYEIPEVPDFPTQVPFNPSDSDDTGNVPEFDFSGDMPSGGLADDETRLTAWFSVQIIGAISGCNAPTVDGTTITVLQQPNSSGVWVEEWNVNCGDGTSMPFKVTFTPENGIVNVNVEMPPQ